MPGKRTNSYPSLTEIEQLREDGATWQEIASECGVPRTSLIAHYESNRSRDRGDGLTENQDGSRTGVVAEGWTADQVIEHFGDDPDKCIVTNKSATLWGDPEEPQERLKVSWVREQDLVQPADPEGWEPPKPRKPKKQKVRRAFVISDHHAPHHEPTFHRLALERLADTQPDQIDINGDLLDFSTISRHRERDGWAQSVNECIQAGFGILSDYRRVCPEAKITLKRGNHDERLIHAIVDNARALHRVTPAGEEVPALDLRRLLHLDALHIDYVDEPWDQAKVALSRKLHSRHGVSTTATAGKAMLDKLAGSTIQGHDHRLSMTLRTEHTGDPDDPLRVRLAMSSGCACIIPGGLGYVPGGEPDWQNAAAEFTIWDNGDFLAAPVVYVPGRLLCSDKRYTA